MTITFNEVKFYKKNGYLVKKDLIPKREIYKINDLVKNIISKEILRILRNSEGKREPDSPQGNGAKCFPGAAAPESKRLPVGPLQKKLPGASSHFFELCGSDFGNSIFLRISKDP